MVISVLVIIAVRKPALSSDKKIMVMLVLVIIAVRKPALLSDQRILVISVLVILSVRKPALLSDTEDNGNISTSDNSSEETSLIIGYRG